jgi:hypothetical protein
VVDGVSMSGPASGPAEGFDVARARERCGDTELLHWLGSQDVLDVDGETARAAVKVHGLRNDLLAALAEIERLRGALEAMLPGRLGSEHDYLTNAQYHACVHLAQHALEPPQ